MMSKNLDELKSINLEELNLLELEAINGGRNIGESIAYHMGQMTGMAKAFIDGFLSAF